MMKSCLPILLTLTSFVYATDNLDKRVFYENKCPCTNKECKDKGCPDNCKCNAKKMPVGDHETITIPQFLTLNKPGRPLELEANTTATSVLWFVWDSEHADVITRNDSGTKAMFFADQEGTYIVVAVIATIHDGKAIAVKSNTCIITVGKPTPPTPPNPPPPDDKDDLDAFQTSVYKEYVNLNKPKDDMAKLAQYYKDCVAIINDPAVNNTMILDMSLKAEAKNKLGNALMPIRSLTQTYLRSKFPQNASILTTELRQQWATEFSYLAESMRKVGK